MAKITKKMETVVVDERLIGVRCDECGEVIEPYEVRKVPEIEQPKRVRYAKCKRGHHDWGNDSGDSIDKFDICENCLGRWLYDQRLYCADNETGYVIVKMVSMPVYGD